MNSEYMKRDPEGDAVWFTDGGSNELYFVVKDGAVRRFHMSFLGNYLEGSAGRPLRTGHVMEESDDSGSRLAKGSAMVDLAEGTSRQAIELARQVLRNIGELSEERREAIERLIGNGEIQALGRAK
jgi:hypothetical protein